jgi:hypothetical protein
MIVPTIRLADDCWLQDVVLQVLVDEDHNHEDDQREQADRERDDADDDPGEQRADVGDHIEFSGD